MSLSREDKDQLAGMLSAALQKPAASLGDKLSAIEILRRWVWILLVAALMIGAEVDQRRRNTVRIDKLEARMKNLRPKVLKMWWQVEQGYTNHDLKDLHISPPEFPEDD